MKYFAPVFFAASVVFAAWVRADNPAVAQQLLQQLKTFKTLQADFVQESYDANSHLLQKQNGSFKVTDSGEFIWDILTPYAQKIISDGKSLKIYDPDLEQLTIKPVDKKTQVIPLLLFGGESEKLTQQYTVSNVSPGIYSLSAQNKNNLFETLQITFKAGHPDSLVIVDSLKQKTAVSFSHVILNQAVPSSTFHFDPPAGVDIVDERKIDEGSVDKKKVDER